MKSFICDECGIVFTRKRQTKNVQKHFCSIVCVGKNAGRSRRKYSFNEDYFNTIDSEAKAYWLGFLLGDGSITIRNGVPYSLVLELKTGDYNHILHFSKCINNTGIISLVTRKPNKKTNNVYTSNVIRLSSHKMMKHLIEMGWLEFKNNGNVNILQSVNEKFLPLLLRGLLDADGCLHISKKNQACFKFIDLHKNVVDWYHQSLIDNLDIKPVKIKQQGKAFTFIHEGNQKVSKIMDFIYNDNGPFLLRKKETYLKIKELSKLKENIKK